MNTMTIPTKDSPTLVKVGSSFLVATVLTGLAYFLGLSLNWFPDGVNYLEAFAVFTSFSCTYLCVLETRWNYPIGIISTASLALLFYQSSLLGSMAQNLYLIPTLMYGFWVWGRDDQTKPVERAKLKTLPIYLAVTLALYGAILYTINYFGGEMAALDGFIVASAILAQFLLDRKKLLTWTIWAIGNIVAIYVYFNAGLYFVAFQFVFFLANTLYGHYSWKRSMVETAA